MTIEPQFFARHTKRGESLDDAGLPNFPTRTTMDLNYVRTLSEWPQWLDYSTWDRIETTLDNYIFKHKTEGYFLNVFNAFVLWHVKHSSQVNWYRDERDYADYVASAGRTGDNINMSYTRQGIILAMRELLSLNWSNHKPGNDENWIIFYHSNYIEEVFIRVVDGFQGKPTPLAEWYFLDSGFYPTINSVMVMESRFQTADFKQWVCAVTEGKTRGIDATFWDDDGNEISIPNYFGDCLAKSPKMLDVATLPFEWGKLAAEKRAGAIKADYAIAISDWVIYPYKDYLKYSWPIQFALSIEDFWNILVKRNLIPYSDTLDYENMPIVAFDFACVPLILAELDWIDADKLDESGRAKMLQSALDLGSTKWDFLDYIITDNFEGDDPHLWNDSQATAEFMNCYIAWER